MCATIRSVLDAEVGYGIGAPLSRGVATPHAGLSLASEGEHSWRGGARWNLASDATLELEATRREAVRVDAVPDNAIRLKLGVRF